MKLAASIAVVLFLAVIAVTVTIADPHADDDDSGGACSGCGGSGHTMLAANEGTSQTMGTMPMAHSDSTMKTIFNTDSLYTCPMHEQVVATDKDARCPICGMKLKLMTTEQVNTLRTSHPKSCPMHPMIVYHGDDKASKCPVCKMNLTPVKVPDDMGGSNAPHP